MTSAAGPLGLLRCPRCVGGLQAGGDSLLCGSCGERFAVSEGIPRLFWPNEWDGRQDVTEIVKQFYEKTPFPDYDDFDSPSSLSAKAREGVFARLLEEQVPPGSKILECGCGTGQLSSFLSLSNRTVYATDMCLNSLRLGQRFAATHGLDGVHFVQMNLFRPAFEPATFDLVISNGVLHHTSDPFLGFRTISELVRPGGYLLVGLYHAYGRLITDARRRLFRWTGGRLRWLDPNLRGAQRSRAKKEAWFADQYRHPHESKHTVGQALRWLDEIGFAFVKSIPRTKPFSPISSDEILFRPEAPGSAPERILAELGMLARGSREGGFFTVIGRRPS